MGMFTKLQKDIAKGTELVDEAFPDDYDKVDAAFMKVKCDLTPGEWVGWYAQDELKFYRDCDGADDAETEIRKSPPWSGIVIPVPGWENTGREMEIEDAVIVVMESPTEKCGPDVDYMTLCRLISNEDLVEVFSLKDEAETADPTDPAERKET